MCANLILIYYHNKIHNRKNPVLTRILAILCFYSYFGFPIEKIDQSMSRVYCNILCNRTRVSVTVKRGIAGRNYLSHSKLILPMFIL